MTTEENKSQNSDSQRPDSQRPGTGSGIETGGTPWMSTPPSGRSTDRPPGSEIETPGVRRVRLLGEGGFGEVWLVEYLGALEARKYLGKRSGSHQDAFREAINTRSVSHANVVRVTDVIEEGGFPVLRMEYVEGRDLARIVAEDGVISLEQTISMAIQVADALQCTHERGIVHLDLKPSNLILRQEDNKVVVTDFGISAALRRDIAETEGDPGGTPYFMAPELHVAGGRGSPQSDIWSLGITIYYLLSNTYPFPFDKMKPREAVLEEPKKLWESHRYVSKALWTILEKMLQIDPEKRYASMTEIRKDLEEYAHAVVCTDCGQPFRYESISGMCPNPKCQTKTVVSLKAAQLSRRAAETALMECYFDEAAKGFRKAREGYSKIAECKAAVAELDTILNAVDGLSKDHGETAAAIEHLLENNRMIECVNRVKRARVQFSRSKEIIRLRQEVRDRLVETYNKTPDLVKQDLRQRNFDQARDLLTRMDHMFGDPPTRAELFTAFGKKPEEYRWLYQEVDRQQQLCSSTLRKAERAIQSFDFKAAFDAYSRLERDFPSEEFRHMLSALGRAEEIHRTATYLSEEQIRQLSADPSAMDQSGHLRLEESRQACENLLEDFPVEQYDSYVQIAERRDMLTEIIAAIRKLVAEGLERADQAKREQKVEAELEELSAIKGLVLRTDVFAVADTEDLVQRSKKAEKSVQDAQRLHAEAIDAMQAREYQKAMTALHSVAQIAPKLYQDLEEITEEVEAALKESRELSAYLAEEFARIERGESNLETVVEALSKFERLNDLVDAQEQRRLLGSLARVLTHLANRLDAYVTTLKKEGDPNAVDQGIVPILFNEFVPIFQALPHWRMPTLLEHSAELRRSLCGLLEKAEPSPASGLEPILQSGVRILELMSPGALGPALRVCAPPPGMSHPAQRLARLVVDAFAKANREKRHFLYGEAEEFVRQLASTCPQDIATLIEQDARELKKLSVQDWWATLLSKVSRHVKANIPATIVVIVAFVLGMFLASRSTESGLVGRILSAKEVKDLQAAVPAITDWLTEKEENLGANLELMHAWAQLRAKLDEGSWGELEAHLQFLVSRIETLSEVALRDPLLLDLKRAQDQYVKTLLLRARQDISRNWLAGRGVMLRLKEELGSEAGLLGSHPSLSELAGSLELVRKLVKETDDQVKSARGRLQRNEIPYEKLGFRPLTPGDPGQEEASRGGGLQEARYFLRAYVAEALVEGLGHGAQLAAEGKIGDFEEASKLVFEKLAEFAQEERTPRSLLAEISADSGEASSFEKLVSKAARSMLVGQTAPR